MESVARTPEVPKKKEGEGRITRRIRVRGAPREGRIVGFRRIPRSIAGAILMLGVLVWFFAGISGKPLQVITWFAVISTVFFLVVLALAHTPLRATFDQRWKPKRSIDPLDTSGWKEIATELDAKLRSGRLPRMDGVLNGVAFRLAFFQRGGARTVATARIVRRVAKPVTAFPRRADFRTKEDVKIGDREFDRAFHVQCGDAPTARRLFTPEARLWIAKAEPESIDAKKRTVVVRRTAFTIDPAKLRAMVRAALAMARG